MSNRLKTQHPILFKIDTKLLAEVDSFCASKDFPRNRFINQAVAAFLDLMAVIPEKSTARDGALNTALINPFLIEWKERLRHMRRQDEVYLRDILF